jgi:hypothetical protein
MRHAGSIELDIWIPEYNLALEYQGRIFFLFALLSPHLPSSLPLLRIELVAIPFW